MIASTQKTNSDRLINPKNYDRLFTKTKQRSPPQPQTLRSHLHKKQTEITPTKYIWLYGTQIFAIKFGITNLLRRNISSFLNEYRLLCW